MGGIQQAIALVGRENRRYPQQTPLASLGKLIAEPRQVGGRGVVAPVIWQQLSVDDFRLYVSGNIGRSENEIVGRFVLVQVNEILQHSQRLMF